MMRTTSDSRAIVPRAPIDRVLALLSYRKNATRGGFIARCPSHDDRHPSLSVWEDSDGRVGVKCYAGCESADIVRALRLEWRDLYPFDARQRYATQKSTDQAAFDKAPVETMHAFIVREMERVRAARLAANEFDTPQYRASDANVARRRAELVFKRPLPPIPRHEWEGYAPCDTDPAWPYLYARAKSVVAFRSMEAGQPWREVGLTAAQRAAAADLASSWLRDLERASAQEVPE